MWLCFRESMFILLIYDLKLLIIWKFLLIGMFSIFCGLYRQLSILDCLILNVSYASVQPRLSIVKRTKLILLLLGQMARAQWKVSLDSLCTVLRSGRNHIIARKWKPSFSSNFSIDIFWDKFELRFSRIWFALV